MSTTAAEEREELNMRYDMLADQYEILLDTRERLKNKNSELRKQIIHLEKMENKRKTIHR